MSTNTTLIYVTKVMNTSMSTNTTLIYVTKVMNTSMSTNMTLIYVTKVMNTSMNTNMTLIDVTKVMNSTVHPITRRSIPPSFPSRPFRRCWRSKARTRCRSCRGNSSRCMGMDRRIWGAA
jgi:hypothetical protein